MGRYASSGRCWGAQPATRVFEAGGSFSFEASDIHRVEHWGEEPAVTLHLYSPPLARMGAYTIGENGILARHSMSYVEELKPLGEGQLTAELPA